MSHRYHRDIDPDLPKVPKIIPDDLDKYEYDFHKQNVKIKQGNNEKLKIFHYKGKNNIFNRFVESILNSCCLCCLSCVCLEIDETY